MANVEYIGYRANAKKVQKDKRGWVTVYSERKNDMKALGEYGGDAYPITYESADQKRPELLHGISIAADGVGQGSYPHPSLKDYLQNLCEKEYPENLKENPTQTKLSVFLEKLYGEDFFNDTEALSYATRSFSDVPQNGFFAANKGIWGETGDQFVLPFFERDSQSLGSRIACVGLFYKFHNWTKTHEIEEWNKEKAGELRKEVEDYLSGLKDNVEIMFKHTDAPSQDKMNFYFLCSTVAMWFYVANSTTGKVSALALNCGDARCYIADCEDGVRQISIDDAFDDGAMSAFVHFGKVTRNYNEYHDGEFHARIVELKYPCALFACSDGVYDTCPTTNGKNVYLPYNETPESNDFMFEVNLLDALRRCYSIEDFRREIAFNFYAQRNTHCGESTDARTLNSIKRDDSGTLAGRFFGYKSCLELFEKLREKKKVSDCFQAEDTTENQTTAMDGEENATNVGEENIAIEGEKVSVPPQTEVATENQDPAVASEESEVGEENVSDVPQTEATSENQASAVVGEESSTGAQENVSEVAPVDEAPKNVPTPKLRPQFEPTCFVGRDYNTSLDKLFSHLVDEYNTGNIIPYYPSHTLSSDENYEDKLLEYATSTFKSTIVNILLNVYEEVYSKMAADNANELWGIKNAEKWAGYYTLKSKLSTASNLVAMLKKALAVYGEISSIDEIAKQRECWDNVLAIPEVAERLKEAGFEKFFEEVEKLDNSAADASLEKYNQFTTWFFGKLPKDYHQIIGKDDCPRGDLPQQQK